ncbi:hypothetical protein B0T19DRAFT_416263 [Cercophora scortea]|uniref:Uncharacterized protein n=1 Tax=Cercophora scortea TaxID=314031 RepID=A0AAE0IXD9_9PEZI|nr:hypothetical protein B0T19DRAFT_416263 [Cercophora scortea]
MMIMLFLMIFLVVLAFLASMVYCVAQKCWKLRDKVPRDDGGYVPLDTLVPLGSVAASSGDESVPMMGFGDGGSDTDYGDGDGAGEVLQEGFKKVDGD